MSTHHHNIFSATQGHTFQEGIANVRVILGFLIVSRRFTTLARVYYAEGRTSYLARVSLHEWYCTWIGLISYKKSLVGFSPYWVSQYIIIVSYAWLYFYGPLFPLQFKLNFLVCNCSMKTPGWNEFLKSLLDNCQYLKQIQIQHCIRAVLKDNHLTTFCLKVWKLGI